jgi:peptidoglycan/LPS O-acetylase OafA/YrhL
MEMDYFRWQQSAVLVLTAGTVLLLSSPRSSWIRSLLSSRALVALGVRSYGVYLWHWPLIWMLVVKTEIAGLAMLAIVLPTAIALSALTYRYIEKPVLAARRSYVR